MVFLDEIKEYDQPNAGNTDQYWENDRRLDNIIKT